MIAREAKTRLWNVSAQFETTRSMCPPSEELLFVFDLFAPTNPTESLFRDPTMKLPT
jgi:hypothetical protein